MDITGFWLRPDVRVTSDPPELRLSTSDGVTAGLAVGHCSLPGVPPSSPPVRVYPFGTGLRVAHLIAAHKPDHTISYRLA